MHEESEGIPTRQLLVAFFAVVLLCAVFFSLGYFLGYKERSSGTTLATEQVSPASDVPPTVNPPTGSQVSAEAQDTDSAPPPVSGLASGQSASPATAGGPASDAPAPEDKSPESVPSIAKQPTKSASITRLDRQSKTRTSDPDEAGPPAVPVRTKLPPGLVVQVAALSNQQDALNMADVLESRGYPVLLLAPDHTHSKDIFFRVAVGPYKTKSLADRARTKLAEEGFKPFIRQ